jgi:hypothetical protein
MIFPWKQHVSGDFPLPFIGDWIAIVKIFKQLHSHTWAQDMLDEFQDIRAWQQMFLDEQSVEVWGIVMSRLVRDG